MKIDVGQAIQELLFEHFDVLVPGLGGFTSTQKTATADYVQGVVLPPTKKIEFDPNLLTDDGVLVNHIQKQHTVTMQEAKDAVDKFVEKIKQSLERREIVEIPKVGRLYKDYEHLIRFMPENANLDASTFGLPPVQFVPVIRERAEPVQPPAKKPSGTQGQAKKPVPKQPPAATESDLQRILPWLVLASAILLAISLFFMFGGDDTPRHQPLDKTRVNVKPQEEAQSPRENENADAAPSGAGTEATNIPEAKNIPEDADTEINSYEPAKEKAFIVVHSFGKRSNATNFTKLLSEDGFAPENRTYKNLYRVGIIFPFSKVTEIDSMKALLGKKYKAGPKLFEELDE